MHERRHFLKTAAFGALATGLAAALPRARAAASNGVAPLPRTIDVATLRHRRAEVPAGCRALIRRIALDTCLEVDGVRVTSPRRTAVDLLADDPYDEIARTAIRLLVDDVREVRWAIPGSGRSRVERSLARLDALGLDAVRRP